MNTGKLGGGIIIPSIENKDYTEELINGHTICCNHTRTAHYQIKVWDKVSIFEQTYGRGDSYEEAVEDFMLKKKYNPQKA